MNSAKTPAGKASKGSVGIENLKGRIRLNFPRQWFNGTQKRVSLGLEWNKENLKFAEAITKQMELDWLGGHFDLTLKKYLPDLDKQLVSNVVDLPNKKPEMELLELWDKYCEYRRPGLKVTTYQLAYCGQFRNYIDSALTSVGSNDAVAIRNWMVDNRHKQAVSKILSQLSHAHGWGIKQCYVNNNPYEDLAEEMKQSKALTKSKKRDEEGNVVNEIDDENDRRAFSLDEVQAIIEAYETSKTVSHYAPLVKLLFYTGCRSGEACALRWKHIKNNCTVIAFQDSYDRRTKTTGDTKTYVDRIFRVAVGSKLHQLLKELESKRLTPDDPNESVLKDRSGKKINWGSFANAWRGDEQYRKKSVVDDLVKQGKIKQYLKPYATRHTFITHQVNKGYPAHVVAGWVGNSADVIWQHYFDKSHKDVTPDDF